MEICKATAEKNEEGWAGSKHEIVKERCIEIYKEEKININRYIDHGKKEANDQAVGIGVESLYRWK